MSIACNKVVCEIFTPRLTDGLEVLLGVGVQAHILPNQVTIASAGDDIERWDKK